MKLVAPTSAFGIFVRLISAAVLIAVVAVGAPLHSHDVALDGDQTTPQKASCAACVINASPGLVLEQTDIAPVLQAIAEVSVPDIAVVVLPQPVRCGRAPPAA
jgi:phage tail protein X